MASAPLHQTIDLNGSEWWFAFERDNVPDASSLSALQSAGCGILQATIPGNFELDLQRAGLVDEPFFGMNIDGLRKYESYHVWYGRSFTISEEQCLDLSTRQLTFFGIDCYAEIYLNGVSIGSSDNMLIAYTFDVQCSLRPGENELLVHIRPSVIEAQKYEYSPGAAAFKQSYESLYVRKAPHMYGWDITPRAVSAGLWRAVTLEILPFDRFDYTFMDTLEASADRARLLLRYRALLPDADFVADRYEIIIDANCEKSHFRHEERIVFAAGSIQFTLQKPDLWWPRGRGKAALYNVSVTLQKNGEVVDRKSFRHGVRTITLKRTSLTDSSGSGEFCFYVNGERVFINGSNWVPADAYHSRDRERIPRMLDLAEEVGCNMLRCWGGNVYEDDLFYDICDEKGILIWQDFAMACAVYPRDDSFAARLTDEATQVVRRLRQHPCIALWAGDNECDQAYSWMGLGNPNNNRLTREVLPAVLQLEDSRRAYLPSSPYLDATTYEKGGQYAPEDHLWGPRDYFKSSYYHNALCHFASEIGYHGCPSPESIRKFISADKLWPPTNNDEWTLHASSPIPDAHLYDTRIALMMNQVREMFGTVPDNLEEFSFASQVVQAEAKKHFVELFRAWMWRRTGILWWNLIDCWPQFSDAVVDYYYDKKLAFEYLKRVQQPLCLILKEPKDWRQQLVVSNTGREFVEMSFSVRDVETGEVLVEGSQSAPGSAVSTVGSIPYCASDKRFYRIDWTTTTGVTGYNHYLAGTPPFDLATYRSWMQAGSIGSA